MMQPLKDIAWFQPDHPLFAVLPHLKKATRDGDADSVLLRRQASTMSVAKYLVDPDEIGTFGRKTTFQDPDVIGDSHPPAHSFVRRSSTGGGVYVMRAPFDACWSDVPLWGVAPRIRWRNEARFDLKNPKALDWAKALIRRSRLCIRAEDYDVLYVVRQGVVDYDRRFYFRRTRPLAVDVEIRLDGEKTLVVAMPEARPGDAEDAALFDQGCELGAFNAVARIDDRRIPPERWFDERMKRYEFMVESEALVIPRLDPVRAREEIDQFCLAWAERILRVVAAGDEWDDQDSRDEDENAA